MKNDFVAAAERLCNWRNNKNLVSSSFCNKFQFSKSRQRESFMRLYVDVWARLDERASNHEDSLIFSSVRPPQNSHE